MSLFSFDNHFIFSAFRWGYDVQTKSCQQYNYGGCLGNNNRYEVRPCAQVHPDFQLYLIYKYRGSLPQIREQMSGPEISYEKSHLGCGLWSGLDCEIKGSGPIMSNF